MFIIRCLIVCLCLQASAFSQAQKTHLFLGRSGETKQKILDEHTNTLESEKAIDRALQWLKRHQANDGSWDLGGNFDSPAMANNTTAATAMAMLAYSGAGNTHTAGNFRAQMFKAQKFLLKQQQDDGFLAKDVKLSHQRMYSHALATIALCELYGMSEDQSLKDACQRAIDFAAEAQSPQGGWRYSPKGDSDTSMTTWYVQALHVGQEVGLEFDKQLFRNASRYLDSASSMQNAGYAYQAKKRPTLTMTASGLLCRQLIGCDSDAEFLSKGSAALIENKPMKQGNLYFWNHCSQTLRHAGGEHWKTFYADLQNELVSSQVDAGAEKGSWGPSQYVWGNQGGRLYSTSFAVLCLQSPYRYASVFSNDNKDLVNDDSEPGDVQN